ncbi:hypothetical protein QFC21_006853 [Naganishia friedmannii]|uniref:Uncharacterized protein n=1 Tax=Naganishia friedmannii TaxID=89922 RepID=A0ACC2UZU1_9TREE|nr:hypothetical protein QFC21_006853 [Naganishia friedmannii]
MDDKAPSITRPDWMRESREPTTADSYSVPEDKLQALRESIFESTAMGTLQSYLVARNYLFLAEYDQVCAPSEIKYHEDRAQESHGAAVDWLSENSEMFRGLIDRTLGSKSLPSLSNLLEQIVASEIRAYSKILDDARSSSLFAGSAGDTAEDKPDNDVSDQRVLLELLYPSGCGKIPQVFIARTSNGIEITDKQEYGEYYVKHPLLSCMWFMTRTQPVRIAGGSVVIHFNFGECGNFSEEEMRIIFREEEMRDIFREKVMKSERAKFHYMYFKAVVPERPVITGSGNSVSNLDNYRFSVVCRTPIVEIVWNTQVSRRHATIMAYAAAMIDWDENCAIDSPNYHHER